MECACICSVDYDRPSVYQAKVITARKEHTCCECRETINSGERYEYASGCWDGEWDHHKTCEICLRIRESVCCRGWLFGELRDVIWEAYGIDYVTGDTASWALDDDE